MTNPSSSLSYGRQSIDETDIAAVVEALKHDYLTQGPSVPAFENALAQYLDVKHVVAVSSGTAALHLASLAAGMGPGDLGITSDVTFVASANGMRYTGARVELCDVDAESGLMNISALRKLLAEHQVKMIIPVDLAGSTADLPQIHTLAKAHGALVTEDAAHSLGTTYIHDGKTYRCGSCAHSDMAILSFHPVKHITTLEGGAITTNDDALAKSLRLLRSHGITKVKEELSRHDEPWWYEQQALGYHYRITDVQCALGLNQLRKLPEFLQKRREIALHYDQQIPSVLERKSIPSHAVQRLAEPIGCVSAYHLYVVRLRGNDRISTAELRRRTFVALQEARIHCQVHYIPVHKQPNFAGEIAVGSFFPGAEAYYEGCLSLPMHPGLTPSDVVRVVETLSDILKHNLS